ncbi:serine protease SP24D-like [Anastrepha ludens]|uniref:serine protease SP24D-like n=1 Tax=Anastrepha ludens TaxID=28586 RepID=UPI0023AEDA3D|nr:serine protease SP24D-like [Anastrepha ludens]
MEYLAYFAKLLILVFLVSKAIQADGDLEPIAPRILNGREAARGQFPYQVSVRVGGQHSCGGSIISQTFVVTAAHCVYSIPPSFLTILAGTTNRTADSVIKDVVKVIPHPEFSAYDNDIALLKLNDSLQFNDLIQPIPIASVNAPVDAPVTISGWGRTKEGGEITSQLMYNKFMKTLSPENCAKNIGYNTTAILCLSKIIGNGICEGDDGGPAVYRGILIGVASFHINDCYSTNKPNGFANVSHFNSWLTQAQICNP